MKRILSLKRILFTFILSLSIFILISGSFQLENLLIGILIAIITGIISRDYTIENPERFFEIKRWQYWLIYLLEYSLKYEVKAHLDVAKRVLNMDIKPGIVRVPYALKSELGIAVLANSITNTPGTVSVDVDENKKYLYVHWINVKSQEPEICYENIAKAFEKHIGRVFE